MTLLRVGIHVLNLDLMTFADVGEPGTDAVAFFQLAHEDKNTSMIAQHVRFKGKDADDFRERLDALCGATPATLRMAKT